MGSKEGCGNLRRLSVSRRRTVRPCGFWIWSATGSFKGLQSSKKVLWAKTEGERGIRKLPVRGMDSEVISIGCLHKASQAVRIRRAWMMVVPLARVRPTVLRPCPASSCPMNPDLPKTNRVVCDVNSAA